MPLSATISPVGGLGLKAGNDCRRWNRMAAKADLRVGGQLMLE
jgi:hypothetical protein